MEKVITPFFFQRIRPNRTKYHTTTARRRPDGQRTPTKKTAKKGGVVVVYGSKVEPCTTCLDTFRAVFRRFGSTLEPSSGWSGW